MFKFQKSIYMVFLIIVVAFVALSYFHEVIKMAIFSDFTDFGNYYFYSKALRLNYNIYTLDKTTTGQLRKEFRMPEFVHFAGHSLIFHSLIRGITFFEYRLASIIWLLLNNILLFSSILIILRLACEKITGIDRKFIMVSSIFLVLSFQPLIENMFLGQINLLILLFFVLCLYFLSKKRHVLSGIMLSLGILIKPHFAILLPFFLWKRCYRVFFSTLISFLALKISGILLSSIDAEFDYWTITVKEHFIRYLTSMSMGNLSLGALINRITNLAMYPDSINITIGLTSIFVLILSIYILHITKGRFRDLNLKFILEFSFVIMFIFIIFPVVHEHHYVLLYLPIIFLWTKLSEKKESVPSLLFIISFLLIGLRYSLTRFPIFHTGLLSIFSGFKLYGVIILFFLTAYVIRERANERKT